MNLDSSDYPNSVFINGELYYLKQESIWTRRYASPSGRFHVVSRLLDKSFDESNLTIDPEGLTIDEKKDAGLALLTSGRQDLPDDWARIVEDFRRKYIFP